MRKAEIWLDYQNYIEEGDIPVSSTAQYDQACRNDGITISTWRNTWIENTRKNKERFGSFKDHSIAKFFGQYAQRPCIVAGSGPSLKHNAADLKDRGGIPLVSCLHNFHYLEDLGASPEFYMTLDAGPVVIEEVFEGGKLKEDAYWAMSRERKLIAFIGTDPKLFEKWQGEVYFYNAPIPDMGLREEIEKIEKFRVYLSNGGNVLGASMYFSKGILGCNPIAYVGADFCFSNEGEIRQFHPWNSKYDGKLGHVVRLTDIFGNKVLSWQSYWNFKGWFEWLAREVPGIWINCSAGGSLGAFPIGNIRSITQMPLKTHIQKFPDGSQRKTSGLFEMYQMYLDLKPQMENPELEEHRLLF